jgi:UDP-N-acetylmuramate-alanine ligase
VYCSTLQESIEYLLREARPGDAVLAVGAGSVNRALGELAVLLGARQMASTPHATE